MARGVKARILEILPISLIFLLTKGDVIFFFFVKCHEVTWEMILCLVHFLKKLILDLFH